MVEIGFRGGASFGFAFGAVARKLAVLVTSVGQTVARCEAKTEMQHNLDPARLDDVGVARGRGAERVVARMMRYGLR